MNQAHFHLLVTHIPLVGILLGVVTLAAGMALKNEPVKKTGLFLVLLPALIAVPAYLSGEGAEEIVEEMAAVDHHLIHEHEERGRIFMWLSSGLALLALATIWSAEKRRNLVSRLYIATLLAGILIGSFAWVVGYTGGKIRHPEAYQPMGPLHND